IAVLLNITPDHLDRYEYKMDRYVDSKFKFIQNQTAKDVFIYCEDDLEIKKGLLRHVPIAKAYAFSQQIQNLEGAFLNEKSEINIRVQNQKPFVMPINELSLQGKHNVYNNMASGIIAKVLELRNE